MKGLNKKIATGLTAVVLGFTGVTVAAPPAQAAGPWVCLSSKSWTYAYLETYWLNWSHVKFVNRGDCSYNVWPSGTLWLWRPGAGSYCVDAYDRYYWANKYYKPINMWVWCYSTSGSW